METVLTKGANRAIADAVVIRLLCKDLLSGLWGIIFFLQREEEHALMEHNLRYQKLNQLGEQLLSLFEKPSGSPDTNPDGGKWMTLKDISARLKKVFKGAYTEEKGSYIKIGNFLNRPECKFLSDRKAFGMVYWVKEH